MSALQPFNPKYGSGQNVAPSGVSASVFVGKGEKQVRLINTGSSAACQVRLGVAGVAATVADLHMMPGQVEVLTKDQDHDTVAFISSTGTTLNIMVGEGW